MTGKYLITTEKYFTAPDGKSYQAVWGDVKILEDSILGVKRKKEKITPAEYRKSEDDIWDEDDFNEDQNSPWINHGDVLWDGMIGWFRD